MVIRSVSLEMCSTEKWVSFLLGVGCSF